MTTGMIIAYVIASIILLCIIGLFLFLALQILFDISIGIPVKILLLIIIVAMILLVLSILITLWHCILTGSSCSSGMDQFWVNWILFYQPK